MKEDDMRAVGRMIAAVILEPESEDVKVRVRGEVAALTAKFPMYPGRLREKHAEA
jgi:glycine hydroxymethyltransferase